MDGPDPFDAPSILALRRLVREMDPDSPPRARFLGTNQPSPPGRLALLPGSFNPPTNAHLGLADAVLATGRVDRVDFLIATRTVDKERVEGMAIADRLYLLADITARRTRLGV